MALSPAFVFALFVIGSVSLAVGFLCLRLHADAAGALFIAAALLLQVLLAKGHAE